MPTESAGLLRRGSAISAKSTFASCATLFLMGIVSLASPSNAKIISDDATLRYDLEEDLYPLPQPNGPATARPLQSSPSATSFVSADTIESGEEALAGLSTGDSDVTYSIEIAVDVEIDWRPRFNDDVQLLVNYVAGTFALINGIYLRDTGTKFIITHLHVWKNKDRRISSDTSIQPP